MRGVDIRPLLVELNAVYICEVRVCLLKSHPVLKESPMSGRFACVLLGDSFHTPDSLTHTRLSQGAKPTTVSLVNHCRCTWHTATL